MSRLILGKQMLEHLVHIGLIKDSQGLQRVVLDIAIDDAMRLYIQRIGDNDWLKLSLPEGEMRIEVIEGKP